MEQKRLYFWKQNRRGSLKNTLLRISFFLILFFIGYLIQITTPQTKELEIILKIKLKRISMIYSSAFDKECGFLYSTNRFIPIKTKKLSVKKRNNMLKYEKKMKEKVTDEIFK